MELTWDESKRTSNLVKHGLDFADAKIVFSGATFTFEDRRFAYGEQRFITLGMLYATVVVVAHTERNDETVPRPVLWTQVCGFVSQLSGCVF